MILELNPRGGRKLFLSKLKAKKMFPISYSYMLLKLKLASYSASQLYIYYEENIAFFFIQILFSTLLCFLQSSNKLSIKVYFNQEHIKFR